MTIDVLDRVARHEPRSSMTGAFVKLQGVTRQFGDHLVLRGIDLAIGRGNSLRWLAAVAAARPRCYG